MYRNIAIGITAVIALVLFSTTYFRVDQTERAVLSRWGAAIEVVPPGLAFKMPMMHSTTFYTVSQQTLTNAKNVAHTYTVDNQEVNVLFTVFYNIPPENVMFVHTNAQNYSAMLESLVIDRIKAEMGKVNASHVAENRGKIRDAIKVTVERDAKSLGLHVTDLQLTNMDFHQSFQDAVRNAAKAKQDVERKEHEKRQAIVDADKQREVAKGEADAKLTVAKADAEAIRLKGEAEAKAIRAQAEALQQNQKLVELRKAERWDGVLPVWSMSGSTGAGLFLDVGQGPQRRSKEEQ